MKKSGSGGGGGITIRYETPFHIRCAKCKNMIAKGVRFNSNKKQGTFTITIQELFLFLQLSTELATD